MKRAVDPRDAAGSPSRRRADRVAPLSMTDSARPDLPELDWSGTAVADSRATLFAHATGLARSAEHWYATKRRRKRWSGRALRVGAILLGAVAAIMPILSEIVADNERSFPIAPAWATVALAAAATMVALDRLLGYTTG